MTFRDGQAKGSPNHATSPAAALLLFWPIFWVALALLSTACSDRASPEQQVRAVIDADGDRSRSARRRRADGAPLRQLPRRAGPGPPTGRARYARGYFIANQSMHLLTRIESLEFPAADEARVKLQVGMAGRGGSTGEAGTRSRPARLRSGPGARGRRLEGQLRGLGSALTQVSTSVICDRFLRVVFNRPPAKRSLQRASAARSHAAESC